MRLTSIAVICLLAAGLTAGCGGSSASSETTPEKLASSLPPSVPLPTDPWAVIPDGASSVVSADVVALRGSPHADFLKQWGRAAGCLRPEHEALLFDRTERALAAAWPEKEGAAPALAVLKGAYTEGDTQTVLDAYAAITRAERAPVAEEQHGRIRVLKRGVAAAARIGDGLLVLGTVSEVQSAVLLAEGSKAKRLYDGELLTSTGARDELPANAIVLVGVASETMQKRAGKSLGAVGMPRDLLSGTLLGLLKMTDGGVQVEARVRKASPEAAASTAKAIQSKLGQLSLLARLAGLPRVLEQTQARASGDVLQIALSASHADIVALRERMHDVLADTSACTP
jgi:hypothetical protein